MVSMIPSVLYSGMSSLCVCVCVCVLVRDSFRGHTGMGMRLSSLLSEEMTFAIVVNLNPKMVC